MALASCWSAATPFLSTTILPEPNRSCSASDTYTFPFLTFTVRSFSLKLRSAADIRFFRSLTALSLSERTCSSSCTLFSRSARLVFKESFDRRGFFRFFLNEQRLFFLCVHFPL